MNRSVYLEGADISHPGSLKHKDPTTHTCWNDRSYIGPENQNVGFLCFAVFWQNSLNMRARRSWGLFGDLGASGFEGRTSILCLRVSLKGSFKGI